MDTRQKVLKDFNPQNEYFVGIDSDGCVFDTMEVKHKECFCPAFVNHFDLQSVSRFAREVWDFVNLYSKTRGCNRFIALLTSLDYLRSRPELKTRNITVPSMDGLKQWVERENKLGMASLMGEIGRNPDPDLIRVFHWSKDVGEAIEKIAHGVVPFPNVKESLEKLNDKSDKIVISQTPYSDIERDWFESGILEYVELIAGQEMGTKSEQLELGAVGKYEKDKILMIGDAPGDLQAAKDNRMLFFPIVPGREAESWSEFLHNGIDRFFRGEFRGEYQKKLLQEFEKSLPDIAPWEN